MLFSRGSKLRCSQPNFFWVTEMVDIKVKTESDFVLAVQMAIQSIAYRINSELNLQYPVQHGIMTYGTATLTGGHLVDEESLYFRTGPEASWLGRLFGSNKGKQRLLDYNTFWKIVTLYSSNPEIRRIVKEELEKIERRLEYKITLEIRDIE